MKKRRPIDDIIRELVKKDPRYNREAYEFVSSGLAYAVQKTGAGRHVSGKQLCEGLRRFAIEQFGMLARTVLASMGIRRTEDFGEIVFNLINVGLFGKTESDSRNDFVAVYDFDQAFGDFDIKLAKDN